MNLQCSFVISACLGVIFSTLSAAAQDELDALFDEATLELTYFNFDTAYSLFGELREQIEPEGSELWQKSTLGLALSAQSKTPATRDALAEAQTLYQSLIDTAPRSAYAARALISLGRIAEIRDYGGDVIDLEAARGFYRQVLDGWPDATVGDEAALRYADTYFQQFEDPDTVAQGVRFLEGWVEGRDDRLMASVIWEVIGIVKHDQLNDAAGALAAFLKADELGLAEPNAAGTLYYRAANLAENEVGDIDTAIRLYQRIIVEAPRSGRAFKAQLALEALIEQYPDKSIEIPQIKMFLSNDEDAPPAAEGAAP